MRIIETGFGYVVIDGIRYGHDIVVCNNSVFKRPKDLSRRYRGLFGHTPLSRRELEYIVSEICRDFEYIVIGTGQYGALPVPDDTLVLLKGLGARVVVDKTPRVVDIINDLAAPGRRILAIIHVTC